MKPHEHTHEHQHVHTHAHSHSERHEHAPHSSFNPGLLMSSSAHRVLGALTLIALLWLAVAWAVGD